MLDFLQTLLPHVMRHPETLGLALVDTLIMFLWSGAIAFVLGLFLGVVITVTKEGGIMENQPLFAVLDKIINLCRSIPFVILLTGIMPLTRLLMGTAIGVKGAIVPLVFGTVPFFARQIESALSELDYGVIEAALSMGLSPLAIIFRVYLKESIAPIARATTITAISLIGLTAMAGVVGAGGLGNYAIMYGHDRNQLDVTWVTIVILVILVSLIQLAGTHIVKKHTH